jgi:hypothetical protein
MGGELEALADAIYLLTVVPSSISLLFSTFMLINIITSEELRMRTFQQLLGVLAFTDFIKCGSWLFGNKYNAVTDLCYFQEYMFLFGAISQSFTTTVICGVALATVMRGKVPNQTAIFNTLCISTLFVAILVALSISFKSARLFCDFKSSRFGLHDSNYPLLGFTFFTLVPIYLSVLLDVVFAAEIHRLLKWTRTPMLQSNASSATIKNFVTRLQVYPLIIVACNLANSIFLGLLINSGRDNKWFGAVSTVGMSSTGILITINYFYYQRTLSPACEKMLSGIWRREQLTSERINASPSSTLIQSTTRGHTSEMEMWESGVHRDSASTVATEIRSMSTDDLVLTIE